jgi:predicted protein tyrosine phosphatase
MIKSVIITDLTKAVSHSYKETKNQTLWISTVDPEDKHKILKIKRNFAEVGIPHFVQYFRDWSDEDPEPFIVANIEEQGPQEQHVNNIISFLETYVDSPTQYDLGINCFAGVSRSTAVGIIAWVMQGKTPREALEEILKVRRQAWPNLRMLRLASARLGKNIMTPVAEWKTCIRENLIPGKLIY